MKLIKINTDHYVVVDDSEITQACYVYKSHENVHGRGIFYLPPDTDFVAFNKEAKDVSVITHSTQPMEHGTEPFADGVQYVKIYDKVKPLPLQEVVELDKYIQSLQPKTEWEVEWETIDNRQPCDCSCHNNPDMIHFVACCNDGWIGKVTQKLKLI